MNLPKVVVAVVLVVGCFSQWAFSQRVLAPLPIESALRLRSFAYSSPVALSSDGEWVAYTIRDPSRVAPLKEYSEYWFTPTGVPTLSGRDACDVWITETKTGKSINLTEGKGSSWNPVWSPNGEYLAFYSDRGGFAAIWIWQKATRSLRQVSTATVRAYHPFETVDWTPDGKSLLTRLLPESMSVAQANKLMIKPDEGNKGLPKDGEPNVVVYSYPDPAKKTEKLENQTDSLVLGRHILYTSDVALIDASSGDVKRLVRGLTAAECQVSPIGDNIACSISRGARVNTQQFLFDLMVISLTTFRSSIAAEKVALPGGLFNWSPDGKSLGYVTTGAATYGGAGTKGDYYLAPIDGGRPRNLTAETKIDFSGFQTTPLWDAKHESIYALGAGALWKISPAEGRAKEFAKISNRQIIDLICPGKRNQLWSSDQRFLYVMTRDELTKQQGIYKVDLTSGESSKLLEDNKEYVPSRNFQLNASADGKKIVFIAQDSQSGNDIWMADSEFRNPKRVTTINPEIDRYQMGKTRLIAWKSTDGEQLHGSLLLPAGYEEGKKYPLVVVAYPGDFLSNRLNHFGGSYFGEGPWNLQLLATRGYAVLFPDVPMRNGSRMADIAKAVLPGVDRVVEMGIADNDHLGVLGHSYGGYGVLSLIVQTTRFKAAVSSGGIGNLISQYTEMSGGTSNAIGWAEKGQGGMGGTPWEFREKYIENSPFFYLDRVQTPLLILHGEDDSSYKADEIFVSLRRLGKEVTYAKYIGESHNLKGYVNQIDFSNRMISWFDKWLKSGIAN